MFHATNMVAQSLFLPGTCSTYFSPLFNRFVHGFTDFRSEISSEINFTMISMITTNYKSYLLDSHRIAELKIMARNFLTLIHFGKSFLSMSNQKHFTACEPNKSYLLEFVNFVNRILSLERFSEIFLFVAKVKPLCMPLKKMMSSFC